MKNVQNVRSVAQYLKGLDLPADKQEVVQCAVNNQAPQDVIDVLQRLPDQTYQQMDDVWRAVGQQI